MAIVIHGQNKKSSTSWDEGISSQVLVGKQDLKLARPLEIGKEISAFVHGFGSSWNVKSQD